MILAVLKNSLRFENVSETLLLDGPNYYLIHNLDLIHVTVFLFLIIL